MDTINSEALNSLNTTLRGLFAALNPVPVVEITPIRVAPIGLGSYVGSNHEPEGDIFGRHIDAVLRTTVSAATNDDLVTAETAVQAALLTLDRADMRSKGLLRIAPDDSSTLTTTAGNNT